MVDRNTLNQNNVEEQSVIVLQELPVNWKMLSGIGIFMIIAGTLGVVMSVYLTLGSILMFGVVLATSGIMQIIEGVQSKEVNWFGRSQHFLVAVLYLIAAGLIVWDPVGASIGVTAVVTAVFIAIGIMKIYYALRYRDRHWKWVLPFVLGLLTVVFGIFILFSLPLTSLWLIGMLIAIELLMNGWFLLFMAMRVKNADMTAG